MKVKDVLKRKSAEIIKTTGECLVSDALTIMFQHGIGALVVMDEDNLAGIITDNDIRDYKQGSYIPAKTKVSEIMNPNIIVALPDDDINYAIGIMTNHKLTHLPIMNKDGVVGIITLSDLRNSIF
ncbi:MAG: CBS domain-containing protein [Spirochaetes bacterium]|jgi:CBS domain-containing protein|nr:CBS domain-containing protein [Spirochaetota bacterium]